MKKIKFIKTIIALLCLAVALPLIAAETGQINYQARLLDSFGRRLNTTVNLSFKIYDAATEGNLLWSETQAGVVVQDGVYSAVLGSQTAIPASVFAQNNIYLELGINGETMTPRQQITASAYALVARTIMGSNIYENQTSGYVGVGTTNPAVKLDVLGTVKATGFKMPTGASANYVLVSDASGVGSWQSISIVITEVDPIHTNWVRTVFTPATNSIWSAIGAEAATRATDDTVLQGNINTEATARGNADTALQGNIDTSSNALNTAVGLRVLKSGDTMTGPLTNLAGFVGNGFFLTNIPASAVTVTGFVRITGDTMSGSLVISNNLTVMLTNQAGYFVATNSISLGEMTISNWAQVSGGNLTNDLTSLRDSTNALNITVTNEIAVRGNADTGISNAFRASDTGISNAFIAADAGISNAFRASDLGISNSLSVVSGSLAGASNAFRASDTGISNAFRASDAGISNALNAGAVMWNNAVINKQIGGAVTYSNLYYLASGPAWSIASATNITTAKGLLGLALGADAVTDGLLLNGSFSNGWQFAAGSVIYMDTTAGSLTTNAPMGTNQVVRILGYALNSTNIYFNPDRTYIEVLGQ